MSPEVEDVSPGEMAVCLREMADDVDKGDIVAFVVLGCDGGGMKTSCCMVDCRRANDDLLDEMVWYCKKMLFDTFEAGRQ